MVDLWPPLTHGEPLKQFDMLNIQSKLAHAVVSASIRPPHGDLCLFCYDLLMQKHHQWTIAHSHTAVACHSKQNGGKQWALTEQVNLPNPGPMHCPAQRRPADCPWKAGRFCALKLLCIWLEIHSSLPHQCMEEGSHASKQQSGMEIVGRLSHTFGRRRWTIHGHNKQEVTKKYELHQNKTSHSVTALQTRAGQVMITLRFCHDRGQPTSTDSQRNSGVSSIFHGLDRPFVVKLWLTKHKTAVVGPWAFFQHFRCHHALLVEDKKMDLRSNKRGSLHN